MVCVDGWVEVVMVVMGRERSVCVCVSGGGVCIWWSSLYGGDGCSDFRFMRRW